MRYAIATFTGINEYGHSHGYGVTVSLQSTGTLVENNVFDHVCYSTVVFGGATGNVIAYNKGAKAYYDFIHGSASHETFFRNNLRAFQPGRLDANYAIGFEEHNTYMNVVGNLLGDAGQVTVYEQNASSTYDTWTPTVFWLGSPTHDTQVEATLLRAANYDGVNGCVWDTAASACVADVGALDLPPSLYRGGKPAWFGEFAWPLRSTFTTRGIWRSTSASWGSRTSTTRTSLRRHPGGSRARSEVFRSATSATTVRLYDADVRIFTTNQLI